MITEICGTTPEVITLRKKISAYPPSAVTPSWMRAPPESLSPITGMPLERARSMILTIFSACPSPSEPPSTVKSCENTATGRPSIVPWPVTTPSAGASILSRPNSRPRCVTKRSSSTNDPGSSRRSSRSRAVSLPASCCRRMRPPPPMPKTVSARRRRSSSRSTTLCSCGSPVPPVPQAPLGLDGNFVRESGARTDRDDGVLEDQFLNAPRFHEQAVGAEVLDHRFGDLVAVAAADVDDDAALDQPAVEVVFQPSPPGGTAALGAVGLLACGHHCTSLSFRTNLLHAGDNILSRRDRDGRRERAHLERHGDLGRDAGPGLGPVARRTFRRRGDGDVRPGGAGVG